MTNLVRTFQAEVSAKNPAERRLNIRLVDYWQMLRGDDRAYPSIQDFKFEAVDGLKPHSFLLEFGDDDLNPILRYVGAALVEDCGRDLTDKPVSEVPRHTLLTQVTDHFLQVLANKAPIAFEAEYIDSAGGDVPFRSIMLPLSSDGETIDCVVGAITRKDKPSGAIVVAAAPPAPHATVAGGTPMEDLQASLGECQTLARAVDTAETRSRDALYRALEGAYHFYFECQARPESYARILARAGLKVQDRAPFTPIVKLVFGIDYDKTRLSEYASALSYAKRQNQIEITVLGFIETHPGGIKGCVAAERAARRADAGAGPDQLERARRDLRAVSPLAEIDDAATTGDGAGDEFVLLLGRRDPAFGGKSGGKVRVLRLLDENAATVDGAVKRAAKALADDEPSAAPSPRSP